MTGLRRFIISIVIAVAIANAQSFSNDPKFLMQMHLEQSRRDAFNAPLEAMLRQQATAYSARHARRVALNKLDIDLHIAIEALESHMTDVRESRRLLADWKSLARAYEMNYR